MNTETALKALAPLVGTWHLEATHPAMPGVVVHGTASVEWLEGERFLIHRARNDHPDFPDSISIIGYMDQALGDRAAQGKPVSEDAPQMHMHYFDSRGVFRVYDASIDKEAWRLSWNHPGFSQRFTGRFADKGDTITGLWQVSQDGHTWNDDLEITYRRDR